MIICISDSILNKLIFGALVVSSEPRQVEAVAAEGHQVKQRLVVITWLHDFAPVELADRSKDYVAFEVGELALAFVVYFASVGKVNQVILTVRKAHIVQLQIPVTVAHRV